MESDTRKRIPLGRPHSEQHYSPDFPPEVEAKRIRFGDVPNTTITPPMLSTVLPFSGARRGVAAPLGSPVRSLIALRGMAAAKGPETSSLGAHSQKSARSPRENREESRAAEEDWFWTSAETSDSRGWPWLPGCDYGGTRTASGWPVSRRATSEPVAGPRWATLSCSRTRRSPASHRRAGRWKDNRGPR